MFEEILTHFIDHHDSDRLAHVKINEMSMFTSIGEGFHIDISCSGVFVKPSKHFPGKKFEIIDTRRKIREFDKVVFYPKNSTYEKGIQANIEIKSQMRIEGEVPDLPKGQYFVSLRSAIDETSKLEEDLSFTVLLKES